MPNASCADRQTMGFDFGLENPDLCWKQKNRWMFQVDGVVGTTNALPPLKSARPNLEFKEQSVPHLVQDIYYPIRPEWKPITLTLYDIIIPQRPINPVFEWMRLAYNPVAEFGKPEWTPVVDAGIKKTAILCLYSGCGQVIESWIFENAYPILINWGELDMVDSNVVTVEVNIRYDRAYYKRM